MTASMQLTVERTQLLADVVETDLYHAVCHPARIRSYGFFGRGTRDGTVTHIKHRTVQWTHDSVTSRPATFEAGKRVGTAIFNREIFIPEAANDDTQSVDYKTCETFFSNFAGFNHGRKNRGHNTLSTGKAGQILALKGSGQYPGESFPSASTSANIYFPYY